MPGSPDWAGALKSMLVTNGMDVYWSDFAAQQFTDEIVKTVKQDAYLAVLQSLYAEHHMCEPDGCSIIDDLEGYLESAEKGMYNPS